MKNCLILLAALNVLTILSTAGCMARVSKDEPSLQMVQSVRSTNPGGIVLNVREFGAVGDGKTNDAAAFTDALAALPSTGGAILFPPGYTYFLDSPAPENFTLRNIDGVAVFSYGPGTRIKLSKNTQFLTIDTVRNFRIHGLHLIGTLQADGFTGNEVQGRLTITACANCEITSMRWENSTQAAFIYTGDNLKIHHNDFINTFNPIQTAGGGSATNTNIWITDNYFLANNVVPGTTAHDDQIATFSGPTGRLEISRNIIDLQGDNPKNCCHGILVDLDSASMQNAQEVVIADNVIRNNLNTKALGAYQRAAIEVRGQTPASISDVTIQGNVLYNNSAGIEVNGPVHRVSISGNIIDTVPASADGTGRGIQVQTGPVTTLDISHNIIHNADAQAIYVRNASKVKIDGNLVTAPGNNGLDLSDLSSGTISGNQVYGSRGKGTNGARLYNLEDFSIVGNVFTGNSGFGLLLMGSMTRVKIVANSWSGNAAGNYGDGSGSTTITLIGNEGQDSMAVAYNAAGTRINVPHIVAGEATLSGGSATIILNGPAAYSNADYFCTVTDKKSANAVSVRPDSARQFTITGAGADIVSYICVGN